MAGGNWQEESNIGQVVYGSVHATTLVINVGGQPRQLSEIEPQQLREVKRIVMRAIGFRRRLTLVPRLVLSGSVIWLLTSLPAAISNSHAPDAGTSALVGFGTVLGISIAAWLLAHTYFGSWLKRHKNTIAELENVLAKVEAELDMRTPLEGFSTSEFFRALFALVAQRPTQNWN